jgi:hypothetical protein
MRRYKTFIVENEIEPLQNLKSLLSRYPERIDLENIVVARTYTEAQEILANGNRFDLSIFDKFLGENKISNSLITDNNRDFLGVLVFNTINKQEHKKMQDWQILGRFLILGKPFTRRSVASLMEQLDLEPGSKKSLPEETRSEANRKELLVRISSDTLVTIKQENLVFISIYDSRITLLLIDKKNDFVDVSIGGHLLDFIKLLDKEIFVQINRNTIINFLYLDTIIKQNCTIKLHVNQKKIGKRLPNQIEEKIHFTYANTYIDQIEEHYSIFKSKNK